LESVPEIKCVYVLPELQGNGVGTILFREMLSHLRNKGIERFCLDSGYRRAKAFWTKRLGDPSVVLPDYWGKDAHHMIWTGLVTDYLI
jgi:GNAT superfamily N-acetyltransferase